MNDDVLTFYAEFKWLAPSFLDAIGRSANVEARAAPRYALKYETLIRPNDPRGRVVSQNHSLKLKRGSVFNYRLGQNERVHVHTYM